MSLLERRYRGFRVINFLGVGIVLVLALAVYFAKTNAGREAAQIKSIERQIAVERREIRALQTRVASLERPDRIGKLSAYLNLAPVDAQHEASPEALASLGRGGSAPKQPQPQTQPQATGAVR